MGTAMRKLLGKISIKDHRTSGLSRRDIAMPAPMTQVGGVVHFHENIEENIGTIIDKKLHSKGSQVMRRILSDEVGAEEFIDAIVSRIKKKQLID